MVERGGGAAGMVRVAAAGEAAAVGWVVGLEVMGSEEREEGRAVGRVLHAL